MERLPLFPIPYPHELLFYTLCRYNKMMDEADTTTSRRLFNKPTLEHKPFFLNNYELFSREFVKSKEFILNEHTPFRYFAPIYREEEIDRVKNYCFNTNSNIKFPYPIKNYELNGHLRYCPVCAQIDYLSYGEPYINTYHCLPNIPFCIYHNCLTENLASEKTQWRAGFGTIQNKELKLVGYKPIELIPIMHKISPLLQSLFSEVYIPFSYSIEGLPERLFTLLFENGFIFEKSETLNHKKLRKELFAHYNLNMPSVLNVMDLREEDFDNLGLILSRRFKTRLRPIIYYLVLGLFCTNMNDFYNIKPYEFKHKKGNEVNSGYRGTEKNTEMLYQEKDKNLCLELNEAYGKITKYENRLMITKKHLLAHTEHYRYCHDLKNLPISQKLIESMIDDPDEYKYQVIRKSAQSLVSMGEAISCKKMKKAGLGLSQATVNKHWPKIEEEFYGYIDKKSLTKRK